MAREKRFIRSKSVYELCMRVRQDLPFPCRVQITLLLKSAMARANRDGRVTICHFIWLGNHLHILLVVWDPNDCKKFYCELQKKITEYMKSLRGMSHYIMWEGRPMVAAVIKKEDVPSRIIYFYQNPAAVDLVENINDYPGLSSWQDFLSADSLQSKITHEVPWVHAPDVQRLPSEFISSKLDLQRTVELEEKCRRRRNKKKAAAAAKGIKLDKEPEMEELVVEPNAWAKCFGLDDDEVKKINAGIIQCIVDTEQSLSELRKKEGRTVIGGYRLTQQQFFKPHIPKKNGTKIFVICSDEKDRAKFIAMVKRLSAECTELYRQRIFHTWPPGMFRPPAPPHASALPMLH